MARENCHSEMTSHPVDAITLQSKAYSGGAPAASYGHPGGRRIISDHIIRPVPKLDTDALYLRCEQRLFD